MTLRVMPLIFRRTPFLLMLFFLGSGLAHAVPPFVWLESEAPAAVTPAALMPKPTTWGRGAQVLSGGQWIQIQIDAAKVNQALPGANDAVDITYHVSVPSTGTYHVWNRIGFEKVRSPFEWRLDSGAWTTIGPDANTVDVTDLQDWNPLGWLDMGSQSLTAGPHTLEIRLSKSLDAKGNPLSLQYASDALCLDAGTFHPNGSLQPDQTDGVTTDDQAAQNVFAVTPPMGAAQAATPLSGNWQITADDEQTVQDRLGPIAAAPNPADFLWRAIPIPSDRNVTRPEMNYVHRYWLRARVSVPAQEAGHAFILRIPSENMIATVFVNGQMCGWTKNPFAVWNCDITHAIHPGQVNNILIGIKDSFYGSADPAWAAHIQYLPMSFWHYSQTNTLDMPVLGHFETGLLQTPTLIVAGSVYTSNVFALPSVQHKTLGLRLTLHNSGAQPVTVTMQNAVVPLAGGPTAKTFAPQIVTIPADSDAKVALSEAWANPKLWWPDDAKQYDVVTSLLQNNQPVDTRRTKFGFREWTWNGTNFALNGVPWHGRADTATPSPDPVQSLAVWRKHGQNMFRLWGTSGWDGLDIQHTLDFFDANGMCVRWTGIFDGEGAAGFYNLTRPALWHNYRDQLAAWIRGQRNHPSVFIWSVENEITFINGHVFGQDQLTTDEHHKTAQVVEAADPTRPFMVDGGNALLDQSFPVYGGHYMEPPFQSLPDGAYDKAGFAHRQVWPVTEVKPILLGESFYWPGNEPADFATVGGEAAMTGRAEAGPAISLIGKMLSEGYRWNDVNFHFWESPPTDAYYNAWQPIAVLCRQWNTTFPSGHPVERTLRLFNDTRFAEPITLISTLTVGGKAVSRVQSLHTIGPGLHRTFDLMLPIPSVATRAAGTWAMTLSVHGKPVFHTQRTISVLNAAASAPAVAHACAGTGRVAVYDPVGAVALFLRTHHIPFTRLTSLAVLPTQAKTLLIGPNALTPTQSASSALAAYASAGRVVIVLEQKNPLHFQALPSPMETTTDSGEIAFGEDFHSPVLAGVQPSDLMTWGENVPVYINAYQKPTGSGRSLVECGWRLADTALAQLPAGKGLMLLSQLGVGGQIASSPVAQRLLLNMVGYGMAYRQVFHPVNVVTDDAPLLTALTGMGVRDTRRATPLTALTPPGALAVISATHANLHLMAAHQAAVAAFTHAGGWLIFNGLTPAGLADYNRLVGVDHLIRPFGQEKVTWPPTRDPLTAGLATSDIVMGSGKQIFNYEAGQYPDPNEFSYVVDTGDIAPFAASSFFAWNKIINGYTMADGFWPLIINFPMNKDDSPYQIPITLPLPETITKFTYVQDLNYAATSKISLLFDGKGEISFSLPPNGEPQTFALTPPRTAKQLTLEIDAWQHDPSKQSHGQDLIGLDNISLDVKRPADWAQRVHPLLNIGALVAYPQGKGGIILCNVKYQATEAVPENAAKKQAILAALLRNLNAPFVGGKTVIAGASNLVYSPIDLSHQANQFTTDQGWFGDKQFTFNDLPGGQHIFGGVPYNIYHFATSPVPTVVMLGGPNIPGSLPHQVTGIPVNRKADALFFLQAARIDQPMSPDDIKNHRQFEMADYVIHYADGEVVKVPILSQISVENYKQQGVPVAVPGAQIAWVKPYAGTPFSAVAYSMQWNNPHPNIAIQSVDLVAGPDPRGIPALLALTAAVAR